MPRHGGKAGWRTGRHGEEGVAMITVLLVIMVITIMAIGSVSYATGNLNLSRRDQDWNAALASAEAGIDDYLLRLNQDGNYWDYSAAKPAPDANKAFSQWVPVPGPANAGQFRYTPNSSTVETDGTVKLEASGRVGKTTRTLKVTLRRRNFLDYVYFTDYETRDPVSYLPEQYQAYCSRHTYDDPPRADWCTNIVFYGGSDRTDVIKGPLHSNDGIRIFGTPDFRGETSSSWANPPVANKRWIDGSGSSNPRFAYPDDPRFAGTLDIPPSNEQLRTETDLVVGGTGCLYTGPTKIALTADAKMTVTSPYTKSTNAGCGGAAPNGTSVSLPPNGVVYVQSLPASSSNPNYRAEGCTGYPISGFPLSGDITPYRCQDGDVLLSGTLDGQLTIGSENNIVITGDVTYESSTDDLLGLVAANYVEVYNPVQYNSSNNTWSNLLSSAARPKQIDAAILSVRHSFRVQNYNRGGALGTLKVTGAIAQKYRGIVGTFGNTSTGYEKDYNYDARLKYRSPPHFIDPVASEWQIKVWGEKKPAY